MKIKITLLFQHLLISNTETDDFKDWFLQERFDKLVNFVTEFGESPF